MSSGTRKRVWQWNHFNDHGLVEPNTSSFLRWATCKYCDVAAEQKEREKSPPFQGRIRTFDRHLAKCRHYISAAERGEAQAPQATELPPQRGSAAVGGESIDFSDDEEVISALPPSAPRAGPRGRALTRARRGGSYGGRPLQLRGTSRASVQTRLDEYCDRPLSDAK
eukprot:GHVU01212920.1.p1 GENE.GHVU01212920.1~~GHVU01212920.1.p1  ORF type:complete len:167 (+),score=9.36 GHVU01212920.1:771-1271(+)